MSIKSWIKDQAAQAPVATFGPYILRRDTIQKNSTDRERGKHPLAGVSASVETAEELQKRVTATRMVLTGVFAFNDKLKKKSGGTSYLTIEGPGFAWVEEVDRKKRGDAVKFAAQVRTTAATID